MRSYLKRTTKTVGLIAVFGIAVCGLLILLGSASVRPHDVPNSDPYLFRYQMKTSQRWQHVSPRRVYQRFRPLSEPSCPSVCDESNHRQCAARTFEDWDKLFAAGKIEGVPLLRDYEYIFPFEKEYLSLPPLADLKKLPDWSKSVIYHVDNKGHATIKTKVTCRYLDQQRFRVDFVDSYGNPRTRGGDEVRVWITGNPHDKSLGDYSASGHVRDLNNGSYLATVTCAWTGYASLKIGLAYPWEYLRAALHNFKHGVHVFVAGIFQQDSVEELTICQSHPNVPGRPCLCNMTDWNQLPFFCGRPLDKRLSCEDLVGTISMPNVPRLVYTPAEKAMSNMMTRGASQMVVKQKIDISVKEEGEGERTLPQKPCSKLSKAVSWKFKYPRGYWSADKKWTSLMCRQPEFSIDWVNKCLQDTTFWIFGDSNGKQIYKALRRWIPCHGTGSQVLDLSFCFEDKHRINITYVPHENTFYSNKTKTLPRFSGLKRYVDLIPATGRHFVIFHYFLHPARAHPSALYFRIRSVRLMIIQLLKRNPNIHIAVRGPHISTLQVLRNHMLGGDVLGSFAMALYRETFRDLSNRIVFLDGWDLTVAVENPEYHPIPQVAEELARTFMSFKCE